MNHQFKITTQFPGWGWSCVCGEFKESYQSKEYAIAAGRRHIKKNGVKPTW